MIQGFSPRVRLAVGIAVLSVATGAVSAAMTRQPRPTPTACGIETTDRIVAVGDVHGAYDRFVAILREAKLIDQRQRWVGGRAILVQTGDVIDRGADSRRALDLLRRLESDAPKAGGRVVALLGNHEVMLMLGDMRYVSKGEYQAFQSPDASELRDRFYGLVLDAEMKRAKAANEKVDERAFRQLFMDKTPLGLVEMQLAFAPDGEYGRWLRTHDAIAVINQVVFMHGGLTPAVAEKGCATINTTVRSELHTLKLSDPAVEQSLMASATGPLWYRGLVEDPPLVTAEALDGILRSIGAKTIVVGHTVAEGGRMRATFDGRVIQIDTGMLGQTFFPDGAPTALEVRDGVFTTISLGGKREVIARTSAPAHSVLR